MQYRVWNLVGCPRNSLLRGEEGEVFLSFANEKLVNEQLVKQEQYLQKLLKNIENYVEYFFEQELSRQRSTIFWVGGWALLVLAFGIYLSIHAWLGIFRPLHEVRRIMGRLALGDWDVAMGLGEEDEMGQLVKEMATMALAIRTRHQMEQHLLKTENLATIGRLACGLAHEICNPLANAALNLQLLRLKVAGSVSQDVAEPLDIIKKNVEKAMELTKEIINFSRPTQGDLTLVNLGEALEGAWLLLTPLMGEVSLQCQIPPDLEIMGSFGKVEKVFLNLLKNSTEAMDGKGHIVVGGQRVGHLVEIWVTDNGPGIPLSLQNHILEPFRTTKHEQGHHGLGLYICQNIAKQYGGSLVLEGEPGMGLTVHLGFPNPIKIDP